MLGSKYGPSCPLPVMQFVPAGCVVVVVVGGTVVVVVVGAVVVVVTGGLVVVVVAGGRVVVVVDLGAHDTVLTTRASDVVQLLTCAELPGVIDTVRVALEAVRGMATAAPRTRPATA